jgi:TPR repeat protein
MHLGRPEEARHLWETASDCPSEAVRLCRLACTHWVERDLERAVGLYRQAQRADPRLGEPAWALAMLHAQAGRLAPALGACRQGLQLPLNKREQADLENLLGLLQPYSLTE